MRIAKLELLAYGPFRGTVLDFSRPGIHVVFGRNEAGKSTSLRAIGGLLYGIDRNTPDAHVHKTTDLRIGGVLEGANGARLRIVRRKGNTKTLLDDAGNELDEAPLRRLLAGVSRETFAHAFGLDHDALAAGAEALLEGKGDLGESLFDASAGGGGEVQRLLADLEAEADAIYKPRASSLPLNEALKAFADAQRRVRERQSLPEAFVQQEDGLAALVEERTRTSARKADLVAKRSRLDRARRRLPYERRRERARERRAELGAVAENAGRIEAIEGRVAVYDRALVQRREHQAKAERLGDQIAVAAERVGLAAAAGTDGLRLEARKETRVHALLRERGAIAERRAKEDVEIARLEREIARLVEDSSRSPGGGAPAEVDARALATSLEHARALGDVDARLAQEHMRLDKRVRDIVARATALGFAGEVDVAAIAALRLPSASAVGRVDARAQELARAAAQQGDRLAQLARDATLLEAQAATHSGDFAPPDATALREARHARDEAWRVLRATAGGEARRAAEFELERLLRDADGVADRMIREADRVTALARIRSEIENNARQQEKLRAEIAAAHAAEAALRGELDALFAPAGVACLGFLEMVPWLDRHAQLAADHAALEAARADLAAEAARAAAAADEVAAAMGRRPETDGSRAALKTVIAAGTALVAAVEAARRQAETAARERGKLDDLHAVRARDEAALADVAARLAEVLVPIGVPADASAEEVTRALEALRELFGLIDQRAATEAHVRTEGAEIAAFEADLARAAADLAPALVELVALAPREGAAQLFARGAAAKENARELATVEGHLASEGELALSEDERAVVADEETWSKLDGELADEIEELESDVSRLGERIGAVRKGLEEMRADSHAAQAAAEAQEALARVRGLTERYARARLAATILAREIDRYREENQGPLLAVSSALFARLTLGAYTGIKAGFDDKDKPSLRCVRSSLAEPGGVEVDVAGLSEGTRDQLYLSLRLASLVRRAEVSEPMPLVLDDVLVQLDDERAAAALGVLAEIARKMQVLFFTHHARLVDLARGVVPAADLVVHELGSPPGASRIGALGSGYA